MQTELDQFECYLREVFRPMDAAVAPYRDRDPLRGHGQGHAMHAAAREAAPDWLRRWDDDKRWLLAFTQGVDGLITLAGAFGVDRDALLHGLLLYFETYGDSVWWLDNPDDDGSHDLCGRYRGKYVDVTHNEADGTWSGLYNNGRLLTAIATRDEAKKKIEEIVQGS